MFQKFLDDSAAVIRTTVVLAALAIVAIPLAIWKLIDIGIWLYNNVSITVH